MTNKILKDNYFIFTGGPGAGKSSVIDILNDDGYITVDEVARQIIKEQEQIGGDATHTKNQKAFCQLMLAASIENYEKYLDEQQPVFFDRGIVGLYGYSKMTSGRVFGDVQDAVDRYRYNQNVFIFPPWEAIYQNDDERKQDFQEALNTYEVLKTAHADCGYNLVEVPKVSVQERVEFILNQVKQWAHR